MRTSSRPGYGARDESGGPFFFGDEPTGLDAIVFGALATTMLTPVASPIHAFLRSQPASVA
jgi:hypothetical protein